MMRYCVAIASLLVLLICTSRSSAADPPACQAIAHRGLLLHTPENTLANFQVCRYLRLGFEFDVRRAMDETLICLHDDRVDRTTNGQGLAAEIDVGELFRLDAGSWFAPEFAGERIPTIEQVFKMISAFPNPDAIFTADLKGDDEQLEQDVVALATKQKVLPQILFIGRSIDHPEVRARLRKADPKCHVACLAQTPADLEKAILDRDSDWVYLRFVPAAGAVEKIRAAGKKTIVAGPTVSGHERENWRQCTAAGANAVLTDYPLEFRKMLREAGRDKQRK